jgi:small conductance mechanosensitive channel
LPPEMDVDVYESVYDNLKERTVSWINALIELLPNALAAAIVMVAFWVLSWTIGLLVERGLRRMRADDAASRLMVALTRLLVLGTGAFVSLGLLKLDKALTSILAGAGIVGLALGFAFQDLVANLISGVGLAMKRDHPFQTGDLIETNNFIGYVKRIDLRTTTLETLDGKVVIIPNKLIYQGILVNHSTSGKRRVELTVGVSYGEDLRRVRDITEQALERVRPRREVSPVRIFFKEFGDSSINYFCWFWIDYRGMEDFLGAQHAAVVAIHEAYRDAGITIPFPIRTLDFGIKGGERLAEVLEDQATRQRRGGA